MRPRLLLRSGGWASAGLLALALLLPSCAAAASELWPVTRLHNADFVALRDVAERFGFKPGWSKPEVELTLEDAGGRRCTFEANQRDFYLDGLRIFLGGAVVLHGDSLWVSRLDLIKVVAPLLRPADHVAQLPPVTQHVIVLDAGHGGIDQGTENRRAGITEKAAALDVALRLDKLLTLQGWKVLMIRTDDRELSRDKKTDLQMRDEFANTNHAELFLSIHFNSAPESITGVETYAMTPQFMLSSADETGDAMTRVAFPSNRFDFANLLFGAELHRAMRQGLKTPDRGFKRGRLAVLRLLDCPGALVECAYLSNDAEARRVATPEFRQQIAEALAQGVRNYAALPASGPRN